MSFRATLYDCSDDPRKVDKTLSGGTVISKIVPTEECDILNPTFILNYDSSYTSKNYVVVDAPFSRSYFITDMKIDIGEKIIITCEVDPLETYKNDIKDITTTIHRTEKFQDSAPYLPDTEYQVKSGFQYYWQAFPGSHWWSQRGVYVLNWVGNEKVGIEYVEIFTEPDNWSTNWGDYFFKDDSVYYSLTVLYPTSAPIFEDAKQTIREDYGSGIYVQIGGDN